MKIRHVWNMRWCASKWNFGFSYPMRVALWQANDFFPSALVKMSGPLSLISADTMRSHSVHLRSAKHLMSRWQVCFAGSRELSIICAPALSMHGFRDTVGCSRDLHSTGLLVTWTTCPLTNFLCSMFPAQLESVCADRSAGWCAGLLISHVSWGNSGNCWNGRTSWGCVCQ